MSGGRDNDDRVVQLRNILSDGERPDPSSHQHQTISGVYTIIGDGNVTNIHGDVTTNNYNGTPRSAPATFTFAPGTIGANGAYRIRIENLLKDIEAFRRERFGGEWRPGVIHGELMRAFGIKRKLGTWRQIFNFPEMSGPEVIDWLTVKRDNTMQGRIEKAASREGYQHTRGHLFRLEKEYLVTLGWDEPSMRRQMELITGTRDRTRMNDNTLRSWVGYLEQEVRRLVD